MLRLACGIMSGTLQDGRRHLQLSRRSPDRQRCDLRQIPGGHVPGRASQSLAVAPRPLKSCNDTLPQAAPLELRDNAYLRL
jgi:hypothetical protein